MVWRLSSDVELLLRPPSCFHNEWEKIGVAGGRLNINGKKQTILEY